MYKGFPGCSVVKNLPASEGVARDVVSNPGRKIPWRRAWQPNQVFLLGKSHRQRSLVGYSPWGCKESYTTEQLCAKFTTSQLSFSFSDISSFNFQVNITLFTIFLRFSEHFHKFSHQL